MFTTDHGPFFALDPARDMMPLIASCEPGGGLFFEEMTYCGRIQSISADQLVSSSPDPLEQGQPADAPRAKVAHKRREIDNNVFIL